MKSLAREYGESVTAAMRDAGVPEAVQSGLPEKIIFQVVFGTSIAHCELDFSLFKTPQERAMLAFTCQKDAVAQLLAADRNAKQAVEQKKVACCPTCSAWFPSFEARNAHRRAHRHPDPSAGKLVLMPPLEPQAAGLMEF